MDIYNSDSQVVNENNREAKYYHYLRLTEEFVDDAYKLAPEKLTENCKRFFIFVKHHFTFSEGEVLVFNEPTDDNPIAALGIIPVKFEEIAQYGNTLGHGYPATVQWMRMLWRAGLVRRFFVGYWKNALKGNVTGTKHGIHYMWND